MKLILVTYTLFTETVCIHSTDHGVVSSVFVPPSHFTIP